ncbi:MAG: hypothetical protein ACJ744_02970 [Gaiellaceae bacterium]|jgi:hypothetical protein
MSPPLVERWTIAIAAAESAIVAAVRAHVFSAHDATDARRVVQEEARWLATAAGR